MKKLVLSAALLVLGACGSPSPDHSFGSGGKADGPGDILLEVDRTWVPPGGKVTATVEALDDQGRPTQRWSLDAKPSDGVRVVPAGPGRVFVSFDVKGLYRLRAVNEVSGAWDEVRIRVDDAGCRIEITEPSRGGTVVLSEDGTARVHVTGRVKDELERHDRVRVNGAWTPVSADGSFSTWEPAKPGINVIRVESPDSAGLPCSTMVSFLAAAEYRNPAAGLPALVRLGPASVALASHFVAALFNGDPDWGLEPIQLADYLPHPTTTTTHAGVEIVIDIQKIQVGHARVTLSPATGRTISLYGKVETTSKVWGNAHFLGADHAFLVTIQNMEMAATYHFQVAEGETDVRASQVTVNVGPTDIDIEWWPDFLAGNTQEQVHDAVEEALRTTVPRLIGHYLDGVAGRARLPYVAKALGLQTDVFWSFALERLETDDTGVEATVRVGLEAERAWGVPEFPGAPVLAPNQQPSIPREADLGLAISTDGINFLLYTLWQAGALSRGIAVTDYLPNLEDLPFQPTSADAAINALLPPVARSVGDRLLLEFGGIQVDLYVESKAGAFNATVFVAGSVELVVVPTEAGYQLRLQDLDVQLDVDRVSIPGLDPEAIEAYVQPLVDSYIHEALEETALLPTLRLDLTPIGLAGSVTLGDVRVQTSEEHGLTLTGEAISHP